MTDRGDNDKAGDPPHKIGVLSLGMFWRIPQLAVLLDGVGAPRWLSGLRAPPSSVTAIAGWGRKAPARRAMRAAARWGLPFLTLEDGFLRSTGLGVSGTPPLSVTVDWQGVHYDAATVSGIELAIQEWQELPQADLAIAEELIELMRRHAIGKYNDAPDLADGDRTGTGRPLVLVVDQTVGDASIAGGGVGPDDFLRMLAAARDENPEAEVRVKVHPDVLAGRRRGFLLEAAARQGLAIESRTVSWASLVKRASKVYAATSLAGMEALIQGVPVTCFGAPFYAGWGLTDDRLALARRTARPSLAALVAAAYVRSSRYVHPLTGRPGTALDVARHLARVKRNDTEFAGRTVVVGLRSWKHGRMRRFLASQWGQVEFTDDVSRAIARARQGQGRVAAWISRAPGDLAATADAAGVPLWRIEDGFLRSVGLGSDHVAAASLVVDRQGIYYDPGRPSDLETILLTTVFPPPLLEEAARLRQAIVSRGLTKYNVGRAQPVAIGAAEGQRRVLVPGQVEDDASVRLGGGTIGGNLGLLRAARAARPDAWIVYKPHPDVEAGNRVGAIPQDILLGLADQVAVDASVVRMFDEIDEVHTLTSLVGFEALIRGLPVTAYGVPFYAGWGLTDDRCPVPRRGRRLSLEELVAGALILYPRYADPATGLPADVWHIVDLLSERTPVPVSGPAARLMRGLRLAAALGDVYLRRR